MDLQRTGRDLDMTWMVLVLEMIQNESSSVLNAGRSHRHDIDAATELVVISNSSKLLENKEIVAGTVGCMHTESEKAEFEFSSVVWFTSTAVIAGGLPGATIGVLLSVILIYKWRKKHKEHIQNKASNEEYHKPTRE
ncbi:hypothetical protein CCH79_00000455, partial [Gambusia affinis]